LGAAPGTEPAPPIATGALWPTGEDLLNRRLSTPVVTGDTAISVSPSRVVGFDANNGDLLWSVSRTPGPDAVPVVPAAVDPTGGPDGQGVVVVSEGKSASDSGLVVLDLVTRERLWSASAAGPVLGAPAISESRAFAASTDGFVYRIDLKTGNSVKLPASAPLDGVVDTAPSVAAGRVFVISENQPTARARLYAIDADTGAVVWSFSPSRSALGVSSTTVVDGTVYAGFGDATVRAFDAASGEARWTQPVRDFFSPWASPAFADGELYVVDAGGGVYAFDGSTGKRHWDFQFPSVITWGAPLVIGGYVYVGMDDGTLAAIDRTTGHLAWRTVFSSGAIGALTPAGDLLLVPSLGVAGGVAPMSHVDGELLDVHSPTELKLPVALLNFAAAFVVVLAILLGLFGLVGRARPPDRQAPGDADAGTDEAGEGE
jgi:outer membrane protein assembly factor BamB